MDSPSPARLSELHRKVLTFRRMMLLETGFDLLTSFRFTEWAVCRYCGLDKTSYHDDGWDAVDPKTGTLVEIKSAHKPSPKHGDGYCFRNMGRDLEGDNEISCYILVMNDLERRTDQMMHFFVIPPAEIPDGGSTAVRTPIDKYKWSPYHCSLSELPERVSEVIEAVTKNRDVENGEG